MSIVVGADLSNNMLMKSLISIWIMVTTVWWVRNKYTEFYQQIPLGDMYVILRMQGNIKRIKWSRWEKPYKFRISEKREITVREVGTASLPG